MKLDGDSGGFTLIELMIAVAVVAILAAIAYPFYEEFVKRTRRTDAMAALKDIVIAQEKYRNSNPTYGTLAQVLPGVSTSELGYYNLAVSGNTATAYIATAAPTGAQTGDSCGTFAVNQDDILTTGSYASADCWRR